jgi:Phytanoyl-CoA dioxygenase (PhyH)
MASEETIYDILKERQVEHEWYRGFEERAVTARFDLSVQSELEAAKLHFGEFGLVVVANAIGADDVCKTLNEIWTSDTLLGGSGSVKDDEESWEDDMFRASSGTGFLSSRNEWQDRMCHVNRQNVNVVDAFRHIVFGGDERLVVRLDRFGCMRPTRKGPLLSRDRPEWMTRESWLHVDQNFYSEPEFCRVQGLIMLADHTPVSGGFCAVPGFHRHYAQWADDHPPSLTGVSKSRVPFPIDEEHSADVHKRIAPVCGRAGDLVIWDSRVAHASYPNVGTQFRFVQYVTFERAPPRGEAIAFQQRFNTVLDRQASTASFVDVISERGMQLYGLARYDDDEQPNAAGTLRAKLLARVVGDNQLLALKLVGAAEDLEASGDPIGATALYRKAYRLYPGLI